MKKRYIVYRKYQPVHNLTFELDLYEQRLVFKILLSLGISPGHPLYLTEEEAMLLTLALPDKLVLSEYSND